MRFKGIAFFLIMLLVVGGIGGLIFVLSNFDTTEKYNITYMTQGGTLNTNYINGENKSYNTKTTYVLPNASYISKSGYTFEGWSQNLFDIFVTQS